MLWAHRSWNRYPTQRCHQGNEQILLHWVLVIHKWIFLIKQIWKIVSNSIKQVLPTQIQCVELFVEEVFSEVLFRIVFDISALRCLHVVAFLSANNDWEVSSWNCCCNVFAVHFLDVFETPYLPTLSTELKISGGVCTERFKIWWYDVGSPVPPSSGVQPRLVRRESKTPIQNYLPFRNSDS